MTPNDLDVGTIVDREDKIRFDQLRKDVANRLKKACDHLGETDFQALVDRITDVQLRGERRSR